ncbi:MAG: hypothetical protein IT269_10300 [Saprospiraceae bacterium]|nr:hypothetical protein [Saprospiraceae bacterium]
MKNPVLTLVILLVTGFMATLSAQEMTPPSMPKHKISIGDGMQRQAQWAKFDYTDVLERAKKGEYKAIKDFLEFSAVVDGVDALDHAVTCIELLQYASDYRYSSVLQILKPNLRNVLKDRFQLAQGRTKVEELSKPMAQWAPMSWAILNDQKAPEGVDPHNFEMNKRKANKTAPGDPRKVDGPAMDAVTPTSRDGGDKQ